MPMELLNEVISSYVKQLLKHAKQTSDNGQASSQKLYLQIELQLAELQDFPCINYFMHWIYYYPWIW